MKLVRNVQIKLDIQAEDHKLLDRTFDQFQQATQHVADHGWHDKPTKIEDHKETLHEQTYQDIRDETDLVSNHVESARSLAADALNSCKELYFEENQDISKPEFHGNVIVYPSRTITYYDGHCTLSTVESRVKADYVLPEDTKNTPYSDYWNNSDWDKGEATLHKRDGEYYLHVSMNKTVEEEDSTEYGAVLGVDLNVDGHIAVTSTGRFIGSADRLNHLRDEYEERRAKMQETGTRSSHLTLQSAGESFSNWSEDYLHRVSKCIVIEAMENNCDAIALENLKNIRENMSNMSKFQQ